MSKEGTLRLQTSLEGQAGKAEWTEESRRSLKDHGRYASGS
jgi:hypothetical protein